MRWTREALAARVEALRAEHEGAELVAAVRAFAEQLDERERELLGEVLLDRAAGEGPSLATVRKDGWFRRQFRRLDEGSGRR